MQEMWGCSASAFSLACRYPIAITSYLKRDSPQAITLLNRGKNELSRKLLTEDYTVTLLHSWKVAAWVNGKMQANNLLDELFEAQGLQTYLTTLHQTELVIWMGEDKQWHAAEDRCPHK